MIETIITELGPWSWWVLGIVLLIAEIAAPGIFFVWIGVAAIVVGAISLVWWGSAWWPWQVQWIVFAILAFVAAIAGRRFMAGRGSETDQPLLNKRGESLVGRTAVLQEPIAEGRGRIKLDDTWWVVLGPDMPVGQRVRVTESAGRELKVEGA